MEILYILLGGALVCGVGVALYEWRSKRTLLKHDFSEQPQGDHHTEAARIQAQDATLHRIMGIDR